MKTNFTKTQMKIFLFAISFFGFINFSNAQTYNWVGGVSTDFYDVNNWDNTAINFAALSSSNLIIGAGIPNNPINAGYSGADSTAKRPSTLTTNIGANVIITGTLFPNGVSNLNGTLTVNGSANFNNRNYVYLGKAATGILNINAGSVASKYSFFIGNGTGGNGLVNVSGGTLYAGGAAGSYNLEVGNGTGNPTGNLNIVGGTVDVYNNINIGTNGHVFISGIGQLIVTGDKTTALQAYITSGQLTCTSGKTLSVVYNSTTGRTTVNIPQNPNSLLTEYPSYVILKNGIIEAKIEKNTSNLMSMKINGVETLLQTNTANPTRVGGYYDFVATDGVFEQIGGATFSVKEETADYIDVSFSRPYNPGSNVTTCDVDIHYVLKKADNGLYTYSILKHKATYPNFSLGSWRQVLWINNTVTDKICVNDLKTWNMPQPTDTWSATGIPEIIKIESGERAGKYDGKYEFSEALIGLKAYGHSSDKNNIGIWAVTANHEYFNSGPTHHDLNAASGIIHVCMNGVHYGSAGFNVLQGEEWSKIYGPYLIYANQKSTANSNWDDAKTRAAKDETEWPFAWLTSTPEYPLAAGRGNITGKFSITDPSKTEVNGGGAWIGVTKLSDDSSGNWQFEEENYQYWVQTDASGNFNIKNVRPGTYTLFAYKNGTTGEYRQETVVVTAATTTTLGNIDWAIPRANGKMIFEIGVPNRTAEEYKFGDFDYCEGFVENKFATTFTNPIEYNVENKNWATALPYVHSAYFNADATRSVWDWNINFTLTGTIPTTGNAKLTIAYASSDHAQNWIYLNGTASGNRITPSSGYYPPNGGGNAFLRQSNHAKYGLATFDIPYSKLKVGKNTLKLQMPSTSSGSNHVMYDYISLEGDLTTLGTNDFQSKERKIKIFPNPTSEFINIEFNDEDSSNITMSILDFTGKTLLKKDFKNNSSTFYSLDIKNKLTSGVYIVKINTESGKVYSNKVIIE
ncbi:polysaccharide lyase family protein [Flavobacterium sp. WC2509]|uniref:polysaccharide lyase family protein n=1 Tax=Flavobacterium sp. WC2509 TaxID=3461406 RepID=UPI004044D453